MTAGRGKNIQTFNFESVQPTNMLESQENGQQCHGLVSKFGLLTNRQHNFIIIVQLNSSFFV